MGGYIHDFGSTGHEGWGDPDLADVASSRMDRPDTLRLLRSLDHAGIGLFECDLRNDGLNWTRKVYDLFGLRTDRGLNRGDVVELYDAESREVLHRLRSHAIEHASGFTLDARITRTDGEDRWIQIVANIECEAGRPVRLNGTKRDITEQRREQEKLRLAAETDGLTGLSNRSAFQTRFLDASMAAPVFRPLGALILFDVDGFKAINDRYGHLAGDACLAQFGKRLSQAFFDSLMVARVGGDEFAVLLPSNRHLPRIARRAKEAINLLRTPIVWNGHLLEVSASYGIAIAENAMAYDAEAMFLRADRALYTAKRGRPNA
ncbi:GGDEF domain-containing protein [Sphingomonas ursincola]|uniref:GGDEF domain-containing protein n=1 Tax=Sphingomonas ursincola TaxID=56361 RepID=UPI00235747C9|nr:diguanylate cyclase [Sphingomonas ursincola]